MLLNAKRSPDYRPMAQQPTGIVGRALDRAINGPNAGAAALSPAARIGGPAVDAANTQQAQNIGVFANSGNDTLSQYGRGTQLKARTLNFLGVHQSPDPAVNSLLQQGVPGPSGLQTLALGGLMAVLGAAGGSALASSKETPTPKTGA